MMMNTDEWWMEVVDAQHVWTGMDGISILDEQLVRDCELDIFQENAIEKG